MNEIIINENKTIICIEPYYLLLSNNNYLLYYLSYLFYYFIYSNKYKFIILHNLKYDITKLINKDDINKSINKDDINKLNKITIIEQGSLVQLCDFICSLYFISYIFNL